MALKNDRALRIALRQNKNVKSTGYNKWYAEVVLRDGYTQRGFINHIMQHIPGVTRAQVESVLQSVAQCLPELVGQGVSVKLDGIGVFFPTLNCSKKLDKQGHVVKSYTFTKDQIVEQTPSPQEAVRGVRFRFRPDSSKLDNLTSKAMKDKTYLELMGYFYRGAADEDINGSILPIGVVPAG